MKKRLRFLSLVGLAIFLMVTMTIPQAAYAGRGRKDYRRRDGRQYHREWRCPRCHRYRRHCKCRKEIRIRFTDRDIDRLLVIGGIYFLSKAISECRPKKEVVYVSPSPQPTYTPTAYATTVVTIRNSTSWYVVVDIDGIEVNLYPGYEQAVSWTYTGTGQYVEARAYQDRRHKRLVGSYQGNLVGYQVPWRLNFEPRSFG
ncbi:hypothetical protein KJA17_00615 [Patescibacteria group bacterium]|nr:hypothetical protein [Patescibacteria group bacterium]